MAGTLEHQHERGATWIKRALLLIILGLVVQLFCLYEVTPATFMIFAGVGVTLVVMGLGLFAYAGLRLRRPASGEVEHEP